MERVGRQMLLRLLALTLCAGLAMGAGTAAAQQRFDRAALDSMLAPIALYPDALLSHVLMAATYPEEVAEAAEWLRARPGLSGDAAVRTSLDQDWDPSVRSLLAFPMVLETLASHMRWTEDLGEAFLSQREEVMDTIQALRRRAYEAGTLRSNEAIRVVVTATGILIEQARPEVVYIPHYDPRVAYGGWWWPSRPPVYWPRWHGYLDPLPRGHYLAWGPGIHISSGFFFGGFVWPRREVRVVHVHPYYYPRRVVVERRIVTGRHDPVVVHRDAHPGVWRHHDWRRRDRDRHDWRRDDDRRAPVVTRSRIEDRDGRGDGSRFVDRNRDGVPDQTRRTDRNRDGVPDHVQRDRNRDGIPDSARAIDRNRDGVPDYARRPDRNRDGVPDNARRIDRDGDGRPDARRSADRDGDGRPDRRRSADRDGVADRREARRPEQPRVHRPDRNEPRARASSNAAQERTERGAAPQRNTERSGGQRSTPRRVERD